MRKPLAIYAVALVVLATGSVTKVLAATNWTEYSSNPVYSPGKAYYPSVLKEGGAYTMWSDCAGGVQMATSTDGINWRTEAQVSGLLNPRHTVVERIGNKYRIWYDEGSDQHLYSIEAIRTATSTDGLTWSNDQPLTQDTTCQLITGAGSGWNRGSYGPGDVIYNPSGSHSLDDTDMWNNKYVMYYMATNGTNEYIGLAYSVDGKHWKRHGAGPVLSPCTEADDPSVGWDYRSVGYPTVIKGGGGIWHMWFCGGPNTNYGIGYAWSNDGINWVKDADNPIFHKGDGVGWRDDRTYTPMVIGDQMWFSGKDADTGVYAIGYATSSAPVIEAAIDVEPDTLNLKSKGKWITCYIALPEGYDPTDIVLQSVRMQQDIEPAWGWPDEDLGVLMVKFDRQDLVAYIEALGLELPADLELTVEGDVDGMPFEGTDTIRVIEPGGKKK